VQTNQKQLTVQQMAAKCAQISLTRSDWSLSIPKSQVSSGHKPGFRGWKNGQVIGVYRFGEPGFQTVV